MFDGEQEEREAYFWTGVLYAVIGAAVYSIGVWVFGEVPEAGLCAKMIGASLMAIAAYSVWEAVRLRMEE